MRKRSNSTCETTAGDTIERGPETRSRKKARSASLVPIQNQSPLLRLPGELRNRIYEYALAEIMLLRVYGFNQYVPRGTQRRRLHERNRLKHVCRQLRHETSRMSATKDSPTFFSRGEPFPLFPSVPETEPFPETEPVSIIWYNNACSELGTVSSSALNLSRAFCYDNPQSELLLLPTSLRASQGCRGLLAHGAALQLVLRGRELPFKLDRDFEREVGKYVRELKDNVIGADTRGVWCPSNLKVYPIDEFKEEELRCSYLRNRKGFEEWIAQIREWYEYGF